MRVALHLFLLLTLGAIPSLGVAQTGEATITNRELLERLTRLEEGQKALSQRLEEVNANLNKRSDDLHAEINQRFEQVDKRFDDLRAEMNKRFEQVDKRFDDINSRFNDVMTMLQIIVSALIALVLAIAGGSLVMWRKILTIDAAVQTKIGLDQAVRDQIIRLEQEIGFVKGKLKELSELLSKS